jgi:hypothetical protein
MRAILINPDDQTITEIENSGSLADTQASVQCRGVCMVRVSREADGSGDLLWLDDDGLLIAGKPVWRWAGYENPLPGRALILGVDWEGESAPAKIALAEVKGAVSWTDLETTGKLVGAGPIEAPPGVDFAYTTGSPMLRMKAGTSVAKPEGGANA